MAGRFSFSVPGRRSAADPWFRIGTLDVGTTVLVVLVCVASMFVWALDPSVFNSLVLDPTAVREDWELWRLVTWPLVNEPTLWTIITIAIFWYFGRQVEGLLGRTKFAFLLLLLTVVPGIAGVVLDISLFGLEPIELAVFLVFIAEYPFARFFFGIPAWAIGGVIVGIQILQYIGLRETERIILLFVTIAVAGLTARSMGLAQNLPWIPRIPWPGGSGGGRARRKRSSNRGPRGGGEVVPGPWSASSRTGPVRSSALPQPPGVTEHDQTELDALLDKISANGMDGLSADEKRRLNDLSKRLRNRK
ncbi:MAG: rhomboid family intramembrane serine protease [Ilumatobacteraceae bacterium]